MRQTSDKLVCFDDLTRKHRLRLFDSPRMKLAASAGTRRFGVKSERFAVDKKGAKSTIALLIQREPPPPV